MAPQPLLDFLYTLPAFIANAPPVIGVSDRLQVKVVLQLDQSLKSIFIDSQLLRSPSNLRANILEAIEDAQKFREHQVQLTMRTCPCSQALIVRR
jgi:DNA-binding protein YbaB